MRRFWEVYEEAMGLRDVWAGGATGVSIAIICLCLTLRDLFGKDGTAEQWKEDVLKAEPGWDPQAVADALELPVGTPIRQNILPAIEHLKRERDWLAERLGEASLASVTLSRVDLERMLQLPGSSVAFPVYAVQPPLRGDYDPVLTSDCEIDQRATATRLWLLEAHDRAGDVEMSGTDAKGGL